MHPDIRGITLEKTSRVDRDSPLSGATALHEAVEIKCFYEGSATLLVESQTVQIHAGDVVVIHPYEFHATVDTGAEKGKYHLFMLPLDTFAGIPELDLRKLFFVEGKRFRTHFQNDPRLYGLLMEAAEELRQRRPGCEVMIRLLLGMFFIQLLRDGLAVETENGREQVSFRLYSVIEPALRCIRNEYRREMTVEELAELCKVSKHYFCHVFKSVTGKSPMAYLTEFRLQVANALLTNTDSSIAEISMGCGFDSSNYFSRCYKKHYGKTPRQSRAGK